MKTETSGNLRNEISLNLKNDTATSNGKNCSVVFKENKNFMSYIKSRIFCILKKVN